MATRDKKGGARKRTPSPRDPTMAMPPGTTAPPPASAPPNIDVLPPASSPPAPASAPPRWPPQAAASYASWWPESSAGIHGSQPSSVNPWGFPPGGFVNLLQQPPFAAPPQPSGENFHFVGFTNSMIPPSPATTPTTKGTPTPNVTMDVDEDNSVEASKLVRKRFWSHDEEVRLASAWLNTSKDPIHGNDRKVDSFWGQITTEYNRNTPPDRKRDTNQLKVRWSRLSGTINEFNGYWISVSRMNKSGYSEDQLMDEAHQMYQKKNGKPFSLVHWWRILKNEPKWCTHVAQMDKEKNKTTHVEIADDKEEHPMGREAAKEQRKGKRKAEQVVDGIVIVGENINKIVEVTQERRKEREKFTHEQLEMSRAALEVAKQQKEAKFMEKEAKFLEAYTALLAQDITNMSEEAKASREKTLLIMQNKLAANYGEN